MKHVFFPKENTEKVLYDLRDETTTLGRPGVNEKEFFIHRDFRYHSVSTTKEAFDGSYVRPFESPTTVFFFGVELDANGDYRYPDEVLNPFHDGRTIFARPVPFPNSAGILAVHFSAFLQLTDVDFGCFSDRIAAFIVRELSSFETIVETLHYMTMSSDGFRTRLSTVWGWCSRRARGLSIKCLNVSTVVLANNSRDNLSTIGAQLPDLEAQVGSTIVAYTGSDGCVSGGGCCVKGPYSGRCGKCGRFAHFF